VVVLGLGSNMPHGRHGAPRKVLVAAVAALARGGFAVDRVASVRHTAPLGPAARSYANSAVLGCWSGDPLALLRLCKQVERDFGRKAGQRWGARVLDIDIWLMDRSVVRERGLIIPHMALASREFALRPLVELAATWRHPALGLSARQLLARRLRRHKVDFATTTD